MRFIHTADWHLGRLFHGIHLTEDQSYVLDQLCDLVREARVDAVIVAGDIYDRAVPPPEAIALLDETVSRLVIDCGVQVIMIAGNHDSPERLAFGSRLLAGRGLHIAGNSSSNVEPVIIEDEYGPVSICPIPYAEPSFVKAILGDESVTDHSSAMKALTAISLGRAGFVSAKAGGADVKKAGGADVKARSIAVAHAFVLGGQVSDSERPLSIGGSEAVQASVFDGFDYVALGHLHRSQSMGSEGSRVGYSGSLLKYSFSEVNHVKSVKVVDMNARGDVSVESISLSSRRDVRRITGSIKELLDRPEAFGDVNDYLVARLTDDGAVFEPLIRLREAYPNVMEIERSEQLAGKTPEETLTDHRKMTDIELFDAFFSFVNESPLSPQQREAFVDVVDQMRAEDREAAK